jgi:PTS system mannitol-specific IIC component
MLETNPGPGLGVLVAYYLFGPRKLRASVPAAIIIHFLGGIHEIYFPYILMKPRLILAAIAGGMSGIAIFEVSGAGLVSSPSPGSIFAYIAETPRTNWWGVYLGVIVATAVSLAVASALLGFGKLKEAEPDDEVPDADLREPAAAAATAPVAAPVGETVSVKNTISPTPALGQ